VDVKRKAIEAIRQWKFEPRRKAGIAVVLQCDSVAFFISYHCEAEAKLGARKTPSDPHRMSGMDLNRGSAQESADEP